MATAAATPATGPKPTLGLTGITINAMALIAPGAFLWTTYQSQAAQVDPGGASTYLDMWPGLAFALILALLTAFSYSQLANLYPKAGTGSSYYFAEQAFLNKAEERHRRWARAAKFVVGWGSHLYYWIYPGVMVAFFATLVVYMIQQFNGGADVPMVVQMLIAVAFAIGVGVIAYQGITGSTMTNIGINIIQIAALVLLSILFIVYRVQHGGDASIHWGFPSAGSIVVPHALNTLLLQSTIAILLLVGFESATALSSEAKNPKRDIPRGVILSLIIQGLICYMFEYFAANYFLSDQLTNKDSTGKVLTGIDAAGNSGAPIGDMVRIIGDKMLGGFGTGLVVIIAITVGLALLGTTLACLNTGVRITYAMGRDSEVIESFGLLHGKTNMPHVGVIVLTVISAVIGAFGVQSVLNLTAITLMSNIGTFLLYGLTNIITIVAFASSGRFSFFRHGFIPGLGAIANILMLFAVGYLSLISADPTHTATVIALAVSGLWLVIGLVYLVVNSTRLSRPVFEAGPHSPLEADA